MRLYISCFFLIITIGKLSAQTNNEELINHIFDCISEKLFGKIWKFDQYCNDSRDSSDIEQDDLDAELFYNGTRIDSILNLSLLNQTLDDLNYQGIKARKSINAFCLLNSWGYSDEKQFYLSNSPSDNETQCKLEIDDLYEFSQVFKGIYSESFIGNKINGDMKSSDHFRTEVQSNIPSQWSQLNTFGRAPPGLLSSIFIWAGDYDNCAKLPSTRYCFGAYRSKNWPNQTSDTSIAYRIGICLPESCNSRAIKSSEEYSNKIDQLIRFNLIENHGITNKDLYELVDLHCPPTHDSLLRSPFYDTLSTILIVIAITWFALIIYATSGPPPKEAALLPYFDLRLSWKRFVEVGKKSPQLEGINALKNITMLWLIITHVYMLNLSSTLNLIDLRSEINSSLIGAFILQGQHGVPPFFIISGLLVGYKYLKDDKLDGKKFIIHRYIRLLPMYLLVYAYVKKFGHLLGSGPIWDYGVSEQSEARQCMMESWLVPILMLANFIPPPSHCILTGWHISNDFQIYLLLPFLLNTYKKSRLRGTLLVIVAFIATHLYHIWNFYVTTRYTFRQFAHEPFLFGPTIILGRLAYDYVNPFGRFGTYFLGVALADFLLNNSISEQEDNGNEDGVRTKKVISSEKFSIISREQEKSTLKLGAGSCSSEKSVVDDENNNECRVNKPLVNLSTDHNDSSSNNNNNNASTTNDTTLSHQQTNQLSRAMQLVRQENKTLVCYPSPRNITDQQAEFKDIILFFLGVALLTICISMPAGSESLKDLLGPFSKTLSYPLVRILCEIGWAMIIYSIITKRSPAAGMKTKTKLEKKSSSVIRPFLRTRKIKTITDGTQDAAYNIIPGLGLTCKFLRLPIWDILVKINYTLILVHFTVLRYVAQSRRQITSFSWQEFYQSMLFTIVVAYMFSVMIYLTVETPLNLIVNRLVLMFERKRKREET